MAVAASDCNGNKVEKDRLPSVNDVIRSDGGKSYRLVQILGEGGYGTVFRAYDESRSGYVALKAEKWTKTVLRIELGVLRATKNSKHFCTLFDYGKISPEYMFIVMSLLGPDLAKLRNEQVGRHFTLPTALRVAMQTCSAIEELHRMGFLSRDIKPGNFAIGNMDDDMHRFVFMFDFGLARKYVDENANVIPQRKKPGWRGTTRYGSLQAHLKNDLGRKDDLESWFYSVIEITKGNLPWRLMTDRIKVQEAKIHVRDAGRKELFAGCPKPYDQILTIIDKLSFESMPPYEEISKILVQCCSENNVQMTQKYDWEEGISSMYTSVITQSYDKSPSDMARANNNPEDGRPTKADI